MRRQILIVSFLMLLTSSLLAQEKDTTRPPVIDVHVHAYENHPGFGGKPPHPMTKGPVTAANEQEHRQRTLAEMKKYNVVKAVVSKDYPAVLRWKAAAPDQIISSYSFGDPALEEVNFIRKEHAAGRIMALGEIGTQYEGIAPNDPRMEPFYALAEELEIPLGLHMGPGPRGAAYLNAPKYRMTLSNPLLLEEVLLRHPKLRLYVMHAGWPMLDQMIGLLWAHPQVYVDTGVIDWAVPRKEFYSYLQRIVEAGFGKRVMFGSDQMIWPEAIGLGIEAIESASFLTEQQKRDILYNNAVEFFRLNKK